MKTIGLIGGMSWESTAVYYRLLNEMTARRLGGLHSAKLVLFSVDFHEIEQILTEGRWNDIASILGNAGLALKNAGADFLVLCTNTMHKVSEDIERTSGLPLLHIVDVVGEAIQKQNIRKVGLLGTKYAMEMGFYQERLEEGFDVEVQIPDEKDREKINRVIFDELCKGVLRDDSREAILRIIQALVEAGCQGVILGCTEIPMLVRPGDADIPLIDTTAIHAQAALERALS
jgi:aspartate racemase